MARGFVVNCWIRQGERQILPCCRPDDDKEGGGAMKEDALGVALGFYPGLMRESGIPLSAFPVTMCTWV